MTLKFARYDLPIAYSMIEAANKIDPKQDWYHPYHKYFYYWTAFNNIYATIAFTGNRSPTLKTLANGDIVTSANGNVLIPCINRVGEQEQIDLAFVEFDNDLKHKLISHASTEFFVNRTPLWQGNPITTDILGQRLNGVLNVNYTINTDHPVWSPLDFQMYTQYLANTTDTISRNFLANQIIKMLYTIRCNLMHGGKRFDDANDVNVVNNALPLLELIISAFTI